MQSYRSTRSRQPTRKENWDYPIAPRRAVPPSPFPFAANRAACLIPLVVAFCVSLCLTGVAIAEPGEVRHGVSSTSVPSWAADAIWYQVFVSRFASGTSTNDPPRTLPWTDEWKQLQEGESGSLRQNLLDRRYGGDLQGLRGKLDYLANLGINALYLNPIFQADTQHKYDTADHRHIDDSFAVTDSRLRVSGETADPETWKLTDSDRVFLALLNDAHARGMRVMIDGVFNHVGQSFWAWEDVKARGRDSVYANWFAVKTWEPELTWDAWDGPNGRLVNFRQVEDGLDPNVERYLFAVVRRWMDPDGDGDPSDGVDGWRLDAAERVPHGFWRRFRTVVKSVNPDALIAGEIWIDPSPWIDGRQFDVVTNYPMAEAIFALAEPTRNIAGNPATMGMITDRLVELNSRFGRPVVHGMLNLLDSHDTARAITRISQATTANSVTGDAISTPDDAIFGRLKLAAFLQFTLPGAPMIYYGDEVGMYGENDPFCRAPMWWPETQAPGYRTDLLEFYRGLIDLRQGESALRRGDFGVLLADNGSGVLAFRRSHDGVDLIALMNTSSRRESISIGLGQGTEWLELFHASRGLRSGDDVRNRRRIRANADGIVTIECAPNVGVLLKSVHGKASK